MGILYRPTGVEGIDYEHPGPAKREARITNGHIGSDELEPPKHGQPALEGEEALCATDDAAARAEEAAECSIVTSEDLGGRLGVGALDAKVIGRADPLTYCGTHTGTNQLTFPCPFDSLL